MSIVTVDPPAENAEIVCTPEEELAAEEALATEEEPAELETHSKRKKKSLSPKVKHGRTEQAFCYDEQEKLVHPPSLEIDTITGERRTEALPFYFGAPNSNPSVAQKRDIKTDEQTRSHSGSESPKRKVTDQTVFLRQIPPQNRVAAVMGYELHRNRLAAVAKNNNYYSVIDNADNIADNIVRRQNIAYKKRSKKDKSKKREISEKQDDSTKEELLNDNDEDKKTANLGEEGDETECTAAKDALERDATNSASHNVQPVDDAKTAGSADEVLADETTQLTEEAAIPPAERGESSTTALKPAKGASPRRRPAGLENYGCFKKRDFNIVYDSKGLIKRVQYPMRYPPQGGRFDSRGLLTYDAPWKQFEREKNYNFHKVQMKDITTFNRYKNPQLYEPSMFTAPLRCDKRVSAEGEQSPKKKNTISPKRSPESREKTVPRVTETGSPLSCEGVEVYLQPLPWPPQEEKQQVQKRSGSTKKEHKKTNKQPPLQIGEGEPSPAHEEDAEKLEENADQTVKVEGEEGVTEQPVNVERLEERSAGQEAKSDEGRAIVQDEVETEIAVEKEMNKELEPPKRSSCEELPPLQTRRGGGSQKSKRNSQRNKLPCHFRFGEVRLPSRYEKERSLQVNAENRWLYNNLCMNSSAVSCNEVVNRTFSPYSQQKMHREKIPPRSEEGQNKEQTSIQKRNKKRDLARAQRVMNTISGRPTPNIHTVGCPAIPTVFDCQVLDLWQKTLLTRISKFRPFPGRGTAGIPVRKPEEPKLPFEEHNSVLEHRWNISTLPDSYYFDSELHDMVKKKKPQKQTENLSDEEKELDGTTEKQKGCSAEGHTSVSEKPKAAALQSENENKSADRNYESRHPHPPATGTENAEKKKATRGSEGQAPNSGQTHEESSKLPLAYGQCNDYFFEIASRYNVDVNSEEYRNPSSLSYTYKSVDSSPYQKVTRKPLKKEHVEMTEVEEKDSVENKDVIYDIPCEEKAEKNEAEDESKAEVCKSAEDLSAKENPEEDLEEKKFTDN